MYNYLIGKLISVDDNLVVLDVNGVGYELLMGAYSIASLGQVGETVKVYTHLNVREDEMSLFGFSTKQEKALFLKLISVSGIGPKVAVSVLSGNRVNDVLSAIVLGDISLLTKMKGIGKKTAERIVLELKDKIADGFDIKMPENAIMPDIIADDDAVIALMTLGYSKQEATLAVNRVAKKDMTTEQIIMQALKG